VEVLRGGLQAAGNEKFQELNTEGDKFQ